MDKQTDFLKNKNLLVIGLGKTGISVIEKIHNLCSSLTAVDSNPELDLENIFKENQHINSNNLKIILGKDIPEKEILKKIDLVITSPGVPGSIPVIKFVEKNKIPVWSEPELAWRLMSDKEKNKTIAVTGTNGKTTVVTLIGKILNDSGKNSIVCGNVGLPLIDTIYIGDTNEVSHSDIPPEDLIRVIEISSFQLERIYEFKPYISVILNITSDHMDRHRTFQDYVNLKLKIMMNQDKNNWAVINADDRYIDKNIRVIPARQNQLPKIIKYSLNEKKGIDLFYKDESIFYRIGDGKGKINIKNSILKGRHNISNIMASTASAILLGVNIKNIEKTIRNFKPLDHRMEYLGDIKGIRCLNDSKSTNPDATIAALNDFSREVTLIMGGKDKNMDFGELIGVLNKKIKNLILIGESAGKIYGRIVKGGYDYKIFKCRTLEAAIEKGFEVAKPGEVLMLSPACASMDMFKDYKERGNKFKSLVLQKE